MEDHPQDEAVEAEAPKRIASSKNVDENSTDEPHELNADENSTT